VVPARSSRHGHLLARGNHAAVARKIHLSRLFSFPEPPLSARRLNALSRPKLYDFICKLKTSEPDRFILDLIQ
jgi:hypothetical protein